MIQIACKTDPIDQKIQKDYREGLKYQLISSVLNQRVEEFREQADPPLLMSAVSSAHLEPVKKMRFS